MSYSVNTNLFKSIFAVPTDIVDKHIRLANGDQLKVLLWILRNSTENPDISEMCRALKINSSDAEDYLQYWVLTGVLQSTGEPIEIPLSPAPNSVSEPVKVPEPQKEIKDIEPSRPSMSEIAKRLDESPEIEKFLQQIQDLVGTIGYNENSIIILLHDFYGLPCEVLYMLIDYCVSVGKKNFNYIYTVGKDWGMREIDNVTKAAEQISALRNANTVWKELAAYAGISNEKPTTKQNEYIRKWSGELKFSTDMIIAAYEEMANHTGKLSFAYMDKVLQNWYSKGFKKPDDIINDVPEQKKPASKTVGNSTHASYDLDKFRQQSLHGELKYERKKKE